MSRFAVSSRQRLRSQSPTSTHATFGSDNESSSESENEEEELQDIEEVTEWLLQPNPEPSSHTAKIGMSFKVFNVLGHFFMQLAHMLLVYLYILPTHSIYPIPSPKRSIPRRTVPPARIGKIHIRSVMCNYPDRRRYSDDIVDVPSYYDEDDTEYVVPPTPGTDETPLRITVTNDYSPEKLKTHRKKGMLRIYRVPEADLVWFGMVVSGNMLLGYSVRRPVDEDDAVGVFRHGYWNWDFCMKEGYWMLIGSDSILMRNILKRCEYRQPPIARRVIKFLWRSTTKIVASLLPWA